MVAFSAAGQYAGMAYSGVALIPDFLWYFPILTSLPWLGYPHLQFENWGKEYSVTDNRDVIIFADEFGNKIDATTEGGNDSKIDSGGFEPL